MVKNVRRMDSNRWATVGLLEITNPHKYWAFWVSYATSPGGTGEKAAVKGLEICGKTGTGNGNEGNWFVGFSPNYLCAVWHGPQMGENKAPQVFSSLFSAIPQNNTRFIRREDIRQAAYCAESGKLLSEGCRNIEVGYFTSDNIPEKCDVHK